MNRVTRVHIPGLEHMSQRTREAILSLATRAADAVALGAPGPMPVGVTPTQAEHDRAVAYCADRLRRSLPAMCLEEIAALAMQMTGMHRLLAAKWRREAADPGKSAAAAKRARKAAKRLARMP